jgi:hypothetical protein
MYSGASYWVSIILDFLASGMTSQEILKQYPGLEEADILACIAYGTTVPGCSLKILNRKFDSKRDIITLTVFLLFPKIRLRRFSKMRLR